MSKHSVSGTFAKIVVNADRVNAATSRDISPLAMPRNWWMRQLVYNTEQNGPKHTNQTYNTKDAHEPNKVEFFFGWFVRRKRLGTQ